MLTDINVGVQTMCTRRALEVRVAHPNYVLRKTQYMPSAEQCAEHTEPMCKILDARNKCGVRKTQETRDEHSSTRYAFRLRTLPRSCVTNLTTKSESYTH